MFVSSSFSKDLWLCSIEICVLLALKRCYSLSFGFTLLLMKIYIHLLWYSFLYCLFFPPLSAFRISCLSLVLSNFIFICLAVDFVFILLGVHWPFWICKRFHLYKLQHPCYNFFNFFSLTITVFIWDSQLHICEVVVP